MNMANEKLFVFIHIPKTGGTTLWQILHRQYGNNELWDYNSNPDYQKMITNSNNVKCLVGHFPFGIHQYIERPCTYFVMLRNPIERVISLYYFWAGVRYKSVDKLSFEQFIECPDFHPHVSNTQTLFLTGDHLPDLKRAKENLKNCFAVPGIMEMFNESLFFIKNECGWDIKEYQFLNKGINRPKKITFSEDTLKIVKEKNELDLELYEFGVHLLEQKIQQLDFNNKTEFHDFLNKVQQY